MSGWIGVDLDGTLAEHDGQWLGHAHIGAPILAMVARVQAWLQEGRDVRIFTARISGPSDMRDEAIAAIDAWCLEQLGRTLPVTNVKDYTMTELWDDRAVQVEPNTGNRADHIARISGFGSARVTVERLLDGPYSDEQKLAYVRDLFAGRPVPA